CCMTGSPMLKRRKMRRGSGASMIQVVPLASLGEAAGRSGSAADTDTFLGEEVLQFSSLEHLTDDVAAADEFALDVKLGDGRPTGIVLNALAKLIGGENVDALVVYPEIVEDLD